MIDRDRAIELARDEVDRSGLDWTGPIDAHFGFFNYTIWTRSGVRGGNVIVQVNRRSGEARIVGVIHIDPKSPLRRVISRPWPWSKRPRGERP